jgi:hypothetical protein
MEQNHKTAAVKSDNQIKMEPGKWDISHWMQVHSMESSFLPMWIICKNFGENFTISNFTGNIVKTERLTSFKMPRDLTLGAGRTLKTNPNKKVYTPNLNVGRTKAS